MFQLVQLPSWNQVLAANTAGTQIINIKYPNEIYGEIVLVFPSGTTYADVTAIEVKLAGKTLVPNLTGTQLNAINKWRGLVQSNNYLSIPFYDRTAKTLEGMLIPALDCKNRNYDYLQISVTFDSAHSGGSTGAFARVCSDKPMLAGSKTTADIMRAFTIQTPNLANGNSQSIQIATCTGGIITAIAANSANITHWEVKKDGFSVMDLTPKADIVFLQDQTLRTTQSGWQMLDFMNDGSYLSALDTRRADGTPANMSFKVNTSGSESPAIIADLLVQGHQNL